MKSKGKRAEAVLAKIEDRIDLRDATKALEEVGAGQTITLEDLERELKVNDPEAIASK